ncbi:LysR family transcriptional regulator [Limibaculum sp. M0105]|uniref:LysR family transcriptional regulator n=1 Tax=Thermohalobaculum xanthum TaxID=2753746 RepID=A0A8J7M450_9RHOB|nr:LysR family transcriptional regulator [Thermohalobaculum xanthum]MBK0397859.1 LysR family transcriptional regulator [Thermohalobaculum xanthum]
MAGPGKLHDAAKLARNLDWNLLRTFIVIAEASSLTDAAERLHLAQPSVSNALKRLEERLGKRLLDRSPGRYGLTETGRRLYDEAVEVQGAITRIATAIRDVGDEVSGHVRIAMASHVVCPLFDDALRDFHHAHPRATLSIEIQRSRDALAALVGRRASLTVCLVHKRSPKLEYRRLYREFFGLFCGPMHPLFGREALSIEHLAGHRSVSFVTDQMDDALRPVALLRAAAGLDQRIVGTSANLEEVRRMILAGLGIGSLPIHVARPDVEAGRLWRLPPYDDPPAIDVHVVWNPASRMNRAEAAFRDRLVAGIEAAPIGERTYR